jgi:hypothetical protein
VHGNTKLKRSEKGRQTKSITSKNCTEEEQNVLEKHNSKVGLTGQPKGAKTMRKN